MPLWAPGSATHSPPAPLRQLSAHASARSHATNSALCSHGSGGGQAAPTPDRPVPGPRRREARPEGEAEPLGPYGPPRTESSARLLSVENLEPKNSFNQRSERTQKQRKTVKGDQIIIVQSLGKVKDLCSPLRATGNIRSPPRGAAL